ncbi:MAG: hypothetical protein AAGC70_17250 [Pseudomonadota bacterium]
MRTSDTKGSRFVIVRQVLTIAFAILVILVGAILLPLPIPLGAPLLALGLILLIAASPAFAHLVSAARHRWSRLDRGLIWLEAHIPKGLATILRKTR